MPTYTLRGIPKGLIPRAKSRARQDGTTLEAVLIRYLETYAERGHPQAAGARALNDSRTAEERSAAARHAVQQRWHRRTP